MTEIQKKLFALKDGGYKQFNQKLIPTVNPVTVIGVRTPDLRKLARILSGSTAAEQFMSELPHKFYEENNLHAYLIEQISDYGTALAETERFLPYVDNWATCDTFLPKVFKNNTDRLLPKIKTWLISAHTYTVRYALGLLMRLYLDEHFSPVFLELAASVHSDEYYINMMIAWYFATALAKQYESTVPYISEHRLDPWTHGKAIQKAIESRRISLEKKEYLRTLK